MNHHETDLKPGYCIIGGIAVHVAEVRKHTKDFFRFMKYVRDAEAILELKPYSPAWLRILDRCEDDEALAATVQELGEFMDANADQLRAQQNARLVSEVEP